jgi:dienelactone hydrolase
LYRRGLDGTLLRCLEKEESDQALVDIHEGIYGGHSNGLAMARRFLRAGYYWPTM